MPELPEVETLVRQLRPILVGRTIVSATLSHDDILDGVTRRTLLTGLKGATITGITRRAKHALIATDRRLLAIQPGMSGTLIHHRRPLTPDEARYAVLRCVLDDGTVLAYRDVRRIGTIRWLDAAGWAAYEAKLGPEPLDPTLTADAFAERVGRSTSAIKKALMNQRIIVGVGNIYANEALFAARIRPARRASTVPKKQLRALHGEVRRILEAAIAAEGSTIRSYVSSQGDGGGFQRRLKVYGRAGAPCTECKAPLSGTHAIDGRQTVWCRNCQR